VANDRRDFLRKAGAVAAVGAGLAACKADTPANPAPSAAAPVAPIAWSMVTAWPADFPGPGAAAQALGDRITRASGGRLVVTVYGGGALVAPFEVFDAVAQGTAQLGHSAAYFWQARSEAAAFFCAVPFGLNAQEMNAWLYQGGGLELWRELYAKFGLIPFPAGNTGGQMAGWFNREITGRGDLKGLKMRIPGLGGEVLARAGGTPVNLPAAEVFAALKSGTIDAVEWMGPHNDLAFGLHKAARYCYYPGWQEPGATLECMVNKAAFEALPEDLRAIVEVCCRAANDALLAEYTALNSAALAVLRDEHKVEFRRLPDTVLDSLRRAASRVLEDIARRDPFARRVYDSMRGFRERVRAWHAISEVAFYQARD